MSPLLDILHEDSELLVVNKPAGLVCHPTKDGPLSSLISRVRLHLGPGANPQLVNRLDRETSGIVLLAKVLTPARELRRLFETRVVQKDYRAIVCGAVDPAHQLIEGPLGKDEQSPVAIKDTVRPDGAPAQTELWREFAFRRDGQLYSLIRARPHTGRKHQIRIHLAWRGYPIVGDKLYGPDPLLYLAFVERRLSDAGRQQLQLPFQALHAAELSFSWRGRDWHFQAEPESWFLDFCSGQEAVRIA